jgi:hypothetical protein
MIRAVQYLALAGFVIFSATGANAGEVCDPHEEGLFRNLGCSRIWDARAEDRLQTLHALQTEYIRLKAENASLKARTEVQQRVVGLLSVEVAEAESTLGRLQALRLTAANREEAFKQLRLEATIVLQGFETAEKTQIGCQLESYPQALMRLTKERAVLGGRLDLVELGAGVGDIALTIGEIVAPPQYKMLLVALERSVQALGGFAKIAKIAQDEVPLHTTQKTYCA